MQYSEIDKEEYVNAEIRFQSRPVSHYILRVPTQAWFYFRYASDGLDFSSKFPIPYPPPDLLLQLAST